jgi:outer membrane protein assembly factor BamB
MFKVVKPTLVLILGLVSTIISAEHSIAGDNNLPAFGGPIGNGHVTTSLNVPTQWSVRTGKNIKWRTELPEGGQSGIAAWKDRIFLTMNKPLHGPKFSVLKEAFKQAEGLYNELYTTTQTALIDNNDKTLLALNVDVAHRDKQHKMFVLTFEKKEKRSIRFMENKRSKTLKHLTKAQSAKHQYILSQTALLAQYHQNFVITKKAMLKKGVGKDIILYCINANTGEILWNKTIKGRANYLYNSTFSDNTSPSPVTDGHYVWAINGAGGMAAFTLSGNEVWSRTFQPSRNMQYDTLIYDNLIFNVEHKVSNDTTRVEKWNYLHAFDKNTGKRLWVSEDAISHNSTPVLSQTHEGHPAMMIGRGGPHNILEKPVGLSLVDLRKEFGGQSIWQWQAPTSGSKSYGASEIQRWNKDNAYWLQGNEFKTFEMFQINSKTGKFAKKYPLNNISRYTFDVAKQKYSFEPKPTISAPIGIQRYTNIIANDKLYYMVRYQPYIAYLDLKTGENIHLEIPTEINHSNGKSEQYIWKKMQTTDQLNSRGQRHNPEQRARGDGTQKAFLGAPIVVNNHIYFTNAHGLTYVVDTKVPFGPKALVSVNDLGEKGATVSLSSITQANGKLLQRSLKEIIAIE